MKKSIIAVLAVSAISTLGSSAAFAHEDYSEGGALHWLEHVQARASSPSERELAAYGYTSNATPSRTIAVNADTRHINVTRLETVALEVGGKTVPLSQNCCRLVRITNPGAIVEERSGEIRTSLQGQSSSAVVAA